MDVGQPATGAGKRGSPPADLAENMEGSTFVPDRRCRRDPLRAASDAENEAVRERARWRTSELKAQVDTSRATAVEGVEAAISAWVADECNRVLGQELSV